MRTSLLILAGATLAGVTTGFAADYAWQEPQARVSAAGDLAWAPHPFQFEAGTDRRYIDFDAGDDANDGLTQRTPWKHHPWDAAATGKAGEGKGCVTYIFKQGVVYRGVLVARESGAAGNPIRLTRDPSWGRGDAAIFGSVPIAGGWKRCAAADAPATMPEPEKAWYLDIGTTLNPRCVFETRDGEVSRIHIARSPNYQLTNPDDPMGDWYEWTGPSRTSRVNEDTVHLVQPDPHGYDGAYVWAEWQDTTGNMGLPYISPVLSYNPQKHSLKRNGTGPFGGAVRGHRYYLENLPAFLDAPGEYYYADKGEHAGRLYLRLSGDRDPNGSTIELGREPRLITILDRQHIAISGLRFSFMNVPLGMKTGGPPIYSRPTAVQLSGDCKDIRIANCTFFHVPCAVRGAPRPSADTLKGMSAVFPPKETLDIMDDIAITDNDMAHLDEGAILLEDGGSGWGYKAPPIGELGRVSILRNNIVDTVFRSGASYNGPTIGVTDGTLTEIAGNILDRCCGVGIWMLGGKGRADERDRPLIRNLVHHNKVTNALLTANDWGAVAVWQGGPAYVYDNISGNPMGPKHNVAVANARNPAGLREYSCNAYAYYLDGMYKSYMFNDIAWGKYNALDQWLKNRSAFMMVLGFMNNWFNNTVYKFTYGATGSSSQRGEFLGNIFADITNAFYGQNTPGDLSLRGGGIDTEQPETTSAASTLAYASNIYFGQPLSFGHALSKTPAKTLEEFREALAAFKPRADGIGEAVATMPLVAPDKGDFRPKPDSPAIGRGVRFFVPWGLRMTVGEWSFCRFNADPSIVLGENLFMSDEYVERAMYYDVPRNDLAAPGAKAEDYVKGTLEDWTEGALVFDGRTRFCVLADKDLKADYIAKEAIVERAGKKELRKGSFTYPGAKRRTVDMDTNDFLIEAVFRTDPAHAGGVLVSKVADAGYQLALDAAGGVKLTLKTPAGAAEIACSAHVNDARWHHVLAEVDRAARQGVLYLDGRRAAAGPIDLAPTVSLANTADFLVGKGPGGNFFAGALDFLRVSRGTLADAKTSIEELYAWEFDGPFLRDFAGRSRTAGANAAGALQPGGE